MFDVTMHLSDASLTWTLTVGICCTSLCTVPSDPNSDSIDYEQVAAQTSFVIIQLRTSIKESLKRKLLFFTVHRNEILSHFLTQ